ANPVDFLVTGGSCTVGTIVAPNSSCTIDVVFSPITPGNRSGTLVVTDTGVGSPHSSTLTGSATPSSQIAQLSTTSIDFGSPRVGSSSNEIPLMVSNRGNVPMTLK